MKNPRRYDRGLVVTCNGKLPVYYTLNVHVPQVRGGQNDY